MTRDIDTLIRKVHEDFTQGRLEQVLEGTSKLAELRPDKLVVWKLRGDVFRSLRRFHEATEAYANAVALEPGNARLLTNLGTCLAKLGFHKEARSCFLRALKINPEVMSAFQGLMAYERFAPDHPYILDLKALVANERILAKSRAFACFLLGRVLVTAEEDEQGFEYYRLGNRLLTANGLIDSREGADWTRFHTMDRDFFARAHARSMPPPGCPAILVTGLPRSGKSLVEALLARHPALVPGGEFAGLTHQVDEEHADPLAQVDALVSASPPPIAHAYARALSEARQRLQAESTLAQSSEVPDASLPGAPSMPPGQQRLIDTSPGNLKALGYLGALHPDVPVVLCQRDPLDQGAALFFKKFRSGHHYSYDLERLGATMAEANRLIAHWLEALPNPVVRIHYEEMVADPEGTAHRLFELVGFSEEERLDAPDRRRAERETSVHPGPLHPSHSLTSFDRISSELVGFGRRFEQQLAPMMQAYQKVEKRRAG